MSSKILSRRELLLGSSGVGALALFTACSKEKPFACASVEGLTVDEMLPRNKLGYSDAAADPKRSCDSCQQFIPSPTGSGCGTCKIMKGPVHPGGSCKSYAPKA